MPIKIIVTLFVVFTLTRVFLRYRDGSIGTGALFLWALLWLGVDGFVWWPKVSDVLAKEIGIGRGVDVVVYFSIIILFYGVFRLYVKMEFIEHEITSLVRQIAIRRYDSTRKEEDNSAASENQPSA